MIAHDAVLHQLDFDSNISRSSRMYNTNALWLFSTIRLLKVLKQ